MLLEETRPSRTGELLLPGTRVTLARASLAITVAVLAAAGGPVALLVALATLALVLDYVDGWVARRTASASALGARMDGEVDAFLILVLSVYVAPEVGWWVVAIGAARYVFGAGELLLPWMRAPLPPRRWRKVVAATQGAVLTVAAAGVLPLALTPTLLAGALVLLAASMAECVWWLWRRRSAGRDTALLTVLAALVVWLAWVAPNHPRHLNVAGIAQIPFELLVVLAAAVVLPARPRRALAVLVGAVLGVLLLLRILDLGFYTAFDRQFDPVYDWGYAGIGVETLGDAIGAWRAYVVAAVVVAVGVALLVLPALALLRVTRVAASRRPRVLAALGALAVLWVGLRVVGAPAASTGTTAFAVREVRAVEAGLRDHDVLAAMIARDRFAATPGAIDESWTATRP